MSDQAAGYGGGKPYRENYNGPTVQLSQSRPEPPNPTLVNHAMQRCEDLERRLTNLIRLTRDIADQSLGAVPEKDTQETYAPQNMRDHLTYIESLVVQIENQMGRFFQ